LSIIKINILGFKFEKEERKFWTVHDSSEYNDRKKVKRAVFYKFKVCPKDYFPKVDGAYSI
jgi:hypothetical protein